MSTFVSVTRARLRSWRFVPGFAYHGVRSRRQAWRAPGFRAGALLPDRRLAFWTCTLWTDEAAMRRFMTSGDHGAAMSRFAQWCDEASVVHWIQDGDAVPDWHEADRRMRTEGRPSRVRYPTAAHAALSFNPPRGVIAPPRSVDRF